MRTSPPPIIIGFAGAAGAGKDTAVGLMRLINGARRLAFGDFVRRELWDINYAGKMPEQMPDWIFPKWVIEALFHSDLKGSDLYRKPTTETARRLLQWWGSDFRRSTDPDYWIGKMDSEIAMSEAAGCHAFAISDVRFPNEADWIKSLGGTVWNIVRDCKSPLSVETRTHASEHALADYPFTGVLDNSGTLEQLESKLKEITCPISSTK